MAFQMFQSSKGSLAGLTNVRARLVGLGRRKVGSSLGSRSSVDSNGRSRIVRRRVGIACVGSNVGRHGNRRARNSDSRIVHNHDGGRASTYYPVAVLLAVWWLGEWSGGWRDAGKVKTDDVASWLNRMLFIQVQRTGPTYIRDSAGGRGSVGDAAIWLSLSQSRRGQLDLLGNRKDSRWQSTERIKDNSGGLVGLAKVARSNHFNQSIGQYREE